ncbi:MAG: hypothetical protein ACRC8S_22935 [Fimbriiglobus sp.]
MNDATRETPAILGFLSIVTDASGVYGGYLVTNAWGRPLEFRLSTAVQPNRVQQILYGPTLTEYLHAELIGKTLIEKCTTQPTLVITDSADALGVRSRVGVPAVLVPAVADDQVLTFSNSRSSQALGRLAKHPEDEATILARLEAIDPAVDLTEPFGRIRDAMAEARKMGVTSRAA